MEDDKKIKRNTLIEDRIRVIKILYENNLKESEIKDITQILLKNTIKENENFFDKLEDFQKLVDYVLMQAKEQVNKYKEDNAIERK